MRSVPPARATATQGLLVGVWATVSVLVSEHGVILVVVADVALISKELSTGRFGLADVALLLNGFVGFGWLQLVRNGSDIKPICTLSTGLWAKTCPYELSLLDSSKGAFNDSGEAFLLGRWKREVRWPALLDSNIWPSAVLLFLLKLLRPTSLSGDTNASVGPRSSQLPQVVSWPYLCGRSADEQSEVGGK